MRLWPSGRAARPSCRLQTCGFLVTVGLLLVVLVDAVDAEGLRLRVVEPKAHFGEVVDGQDLQLSAGDDVTLECDSHSSINWTYPHHDNHLQHEGFEVSLPFVKRRYGGSTLQIHNVSAAQTGFYSCGVQEGNSGRNVSISLYIYFADPEYPWVQPGMMAAVAIQHQEAVLDCRPNNKSTHVRLTIGGSEIRVGESNARWTVEWAPTRGFTLAPIRLHDSQSIFECEADDWDRPLMLSLLVLPATTNLMAPTIRPVNATPHAVLGHNILLQCKLRSEDGMFFDMEWIVPPDSSARREGRLNISRPLSEKEEDDGPSSRQMSHYRIGTINLTITNLTYSDAGTYTCIVKDHTKQFNKTFVLDVKDNNVQYIEFRVDEQTLHQEVRQGGNATWSLDIVTFPPSPSISWFRNMGEPKLSRELTHSSAAKFDMRKQESVRGIGLDLTVLDAELRDRGLYTLKVNTGKDEKMLNLTLEVFAPPVVDLLPSVDPLPQGQKWIGTCRVQGSPLPTVTWAWRPCPGLLRDCPPDGPFTPLKNFTTRTTGEVDLNSTVVLYLNSSGFISCRANNSEDASNDTASLQITDMPGPCTLCAWGEHEVVDGDDVDLWCGVLRENHTDTPVWKSKDRQIDPSRMQVTQTDTLLSLRARLHISRARKNDSGTYVCKSSDADDYPSPSKEFNLQVKPPQKPFASGKPLNNTKWLVNHRDTLRLPCHFGGLPKPRISWYKDGKELSLPTKPKSSDPLRLEKDGTELVLAVVTESDQGEYRCRATNRFGSEERWARIELKNSKGLPTSMVVLIVILVLVLICMVPLALCVYKEKKRRRMVISGLHHFVEGQPDGLNPELPADEQAELLPYDKKWEFPRERLKLGKQLGAGAFGVVLKAEAQGIVEGEESTTVAVKMVKRTADFSYLKALASELKIMVHLGRHLNVVNLLGACTSNIERLELLVIVEYCRFGNLHNYLLRHREGFVDQVDPRTGLVDASIVADPLQWQDSLNHCSIPGGRVKYASLSFSGSSDTTGGSDAGSELGAAAAMPSGPVDYRAAAAAAAANNLGGPCVDSMGNESICMSPTGGDETALTSSGSAQPHWRSNYRGDYRGQVRAICTRDLLCWSYQVARGMQYLAGRKVLHGDLAARNILLADGNIVKICDFGLAKSMYKSDNYKKKGDGPLPVKWMALESIRDFVFSTQSDVWSFGIVLWELFSLAQTPYPGMVADERLYSKLQDGYRMEKPPYATEDLYQVMRKCWEARPIMRPTFEELSETLGSFLEESVRNHYLDLNNAYIDMNEQWRSDGGTDYLGMLGTPDYSNMVSPREEDTGYINSPASPASPVTPLATDGYLMMRGSSMGSNAPVAGPATPRSAEVFSPRPGSGAQVFTFTGPRAPSAAAPPTPTINVTPPSNNAVDALDNPSYVLKASVDNYVNVPQQRKAAARGAATTASNGVASRPGDSVTTPSPAPRFAQQPLCEPFAAGQTAFSNPHYANTAAMGLGGGQHACA